MGVFLPPQCYSEDQSFIIFKISISEEISEIFFHEDAEVVIGNRKLSSVDERANLVLTSVAVADPLAFDDVVGRHFNSPIDIGSDSESFWIIQVLHIHAGIFQLWKIILHA